MKEVIRIDGTQQNDKPVEFTHFLDVEEGWEGANCKPSDFYKVVYLGNCSLDGDMFAGYKNGAIIIFKGHLNSGNY